jgi:hypothetical protein
MQTSAVLRGVRLSEQKWITCGPRIESSYF